MCFPQWRFVDSWNSKTIFISLSNKHPFTNLLSMSLRHSSFYKRRSWIYWRRKIIAAKREEKAQIWKIKFKKCFLVSLEIKQIPFNNFWMMSGWRRWWTNAVCSWSRRLLPHVTTSSSTSSSTTTSTTTFAAVAGDFCHMSPLPSDPNAVVFLISWCMNL